MNHRRLYPNAFADAQKRIDKKVAVINRSLQLGKDSHGQPLSPSQRVAMTHQVESLTEFKGRLAGLRAKEITGHNQKMAEFMKNEGERINSVVGNAADLVVPLALSPASVPGFMLTEGLYSGAKTAIAGGSASDVADSALTDVAVAGILGTALSAVGRKVVDPAVRKARPYVTKAVKWVGDKFNKARLYYNKVGIRINEAALKHQLLMEERIQSGVFSSRDGKTYVGGHEYRPGNLYVSSPSKWGEQRGDDGQLRSKILTDAASGSDVVVEIPRSMAEPRLPTSFGGVTPTRGPVSYDRYKESIETVNASVEDMITAKAGGKRWYIPLDHRVLMTPLQATETAAFLSAPTARVVNGPLGMDYVLSHVSPIARTGWIGTGYRGLFERSALQHSKIPGRTRYYVGADEIELDGKILRPYARVSDHYSFLDAGGRVYEGTNADSILEVEKAIRGGLEVPHVTPPPLGADRISFGLQLPSHVGQDLSTLNENPLRVGSPVYLLDPVSSRRSPGWYGGIKLIDVPSLRGVNLADKAGKKQRKNSQLANFLATDKVPDSIFGIPIVSTNEQYTAKDIAFFKENPEAGGYYDLGDEES